MLANIAELDACFTNQSEGSQEEIERGHVNFKVCVVLSLIQKIVQVPYVEYYWAFLSV
jgi:hypothetical protein